MGLLPGPGQGLPRGNPAVAGTSFLLHPLCSLSWLGGARKAGAQGRGEGDIPVSPTLEMELWEQVFPGVVKQEAKRRLSRTVRMVLQAIHFVLLSWITAMVRSS